MSKIESDARSGSDGKTSHSKGFEKAILDAAMTLSFKAAPSCVSSSWTRRWYIGN